MGKGMILTVNNAYKSIYDGELKAANVSWISMHSEKEWIVLPTNIKSVNRAINISDSIEKYESKIMIDSCNIQTCKSLKRITHLLYWYDKADHAILRYIKDEIDGYESVVNDCWHCQIKHYKDIDDCLLQLSTDVVDSMVKNVGIHLKEFFGLSDIVGEEKKCMKYINNHAASCIMQDKKCVEYIQVQCVQINEYFTDILGHSVGNKIAILFEYVVNAQEFEDIDAVKYDFEDIKESVIWSYIKKEIVLEWSSLNKQIQTESETKIQEIMLQTNNENKEDHDQKEESGIEVIECKMTEVNQKFPTAFTVVRHQSEDMKVMKQIHQELNPLNKQKQIKMIESKIQETVLQNNETEEEKTPLNESNKQVIDDTTYNQSTEVHIDGTTYILPRQYTNIGPVFFYGKNWPDDIKPTYKHLKEEVLHNTYASITDKEWNETLTKCTKILKGEVKSKIKRKWSNLLRNKHIGLKHLVALKLHTDFDLLQREFRKSFRATSNEKKRLQEFFHWREALHETFEKFSEIASVLDQPNRLFHGVNSIMCIDQYQGKYYGPCSTTTDLHVARSFAGKNGMILVMKPNTNRYKVLDISWISEYPDEREYLLFDHQIDIESWILSSDYDQFYHYYHNILTKRNIAQGPYQNQIKDTKYLNKLKSLVSDVEIVSNHQVKIKQNVEFNKNVLTDQEKIDLLIWVFQFALNYKNKKKEPSKYDESLNANLQNMMKQIHTIKIPTQLVDHFVEMSADKIKSVLNEYFINTNCSFVVDDSVHILQSAANTCNQNGELVNNPGNMNNLNVNNSSSINKKNKIMNAEQLDGPPMHESMVAEHPLGVEVTHGEAEQTLESVEHVSKQIAKHFANVLNCEIGNKIAQIFECTVNEQEFDDMNSIKDDFEDMKESVIWSHIIEKITPELNVSNKRIKTIGSAMQKIVLQQNSPRDSFRKPTIQQRKELRIQTIKREIMKEFSSKYNQSIAINIVYEFDAVRTKEKLDVDNILVDVKECEDSIVLSSLNSIKAIANDFKKLFQDKVMLQQIILRVLTNQSSINIKSFILNVSEKDVEIAAQNLTAGNSNLSQDVIIKFNESQSKTLRIFKAINNINRKPIMLWLLKLYSKERSKLYRNGALSITNTYTSGEWWINNNFGKYVYNTYPIMAKHMEAGLAELIKRLLPPINYNYKLFPVICDRLDDFVEYALVFHQIACTIKRGLKRRQLAAPVQIDYWIIPQKTRYKGVRRLQSMTPFNIDELQQRKQKKHDLNYNNDLKANILDVGNIAEILTDAKLGYIEGKDLFVLNAPDDFSKLKQQMIGVIKQYRGWNKRRNRFIFIVDRRHPDNANTGLSKPAIYDKPKKWKDKIYMIAPKQYRCENKQALCICGSKLICIENSQVKNDINSECKWCGEAKTNIIWICPKGNTATHEYGYSLCSIECERARPKTYSKLSEKWEYVPETCLSLSKNYILLNHAENDRVPITMDDALNGYMFGLSYHILTEDNISVYWYHNSGGTMFELSDIKRGWPQWFDTINGQPQQVDECYIQQIDHPHKKLRNVDFEEFERQCNMFIFD